MAQGTAHGPHGIRSHWAPGGSLTFKHPPASRNNVNPSCATPWEPWPCQCCHPRLYWKERPTGPQPGAAPPAPQSPCKYRGPWSPPPFGGSGLGSSCWVQQGHPFWSPTHRSIHPWAQVCPTSREDSASDPKLFSPWSFPRRPGLSAYIGSILPHQDNQTCRAETQRVGRGPRFICTGARTYTPVSAATPWGPER